MANESMRQNWSDAADGWVENEAVYDAVLAPVTAAILERSDPRAGHRVLDVGCGSGTLLAKHAAAGAEVVGIDIAEGMAAAARRRVPGATVVVADAQTADLVDAVPGPPFDRVVSRFGVMFFEDPEAAFANLRRAAAPGARLVFACWRSEAENPIFSLGTDVLAARLDPAPEPPEPGAPGPTAFADAGRLESLLAASGWGRTRIDAFDFVCDFGFDGADGVEERLTMILNGRTGRLAEEQLVPRIGVDGWESVVEEVRDELRRHLVGGAVRLPAAVWLVTAVNPA
ncbi:class I SAM-dependent methyltransferase [Glycomyces sp. TRM65418]|uniref:class I SAM-dependent methyltransferase n=1 Tax=Glycomyces sp. TRM65418 TaxID=2867006 RepID=UPI001CE620D3|nr:class I SAM-dependent methyltransferase [Glycomyces sp. TRM65418]MCC3765864.1 class I SAM-dependent methyltransferase [Glycomyces sp. TRM65418]QZD55449.1 class I SAM-dependent methyltransferase [Glycomyces sp. TRM65418]